jgi:hypothetical protein
MRFLQTLTLVKDRRNDFNSISSKGLDSQFESNIAKSMEILDYLERVTKSFYKSFDSLPANSIKTKTMDKFINYQLNYLDDICLHINHKWSIPCLNEEKAKIFLHFAKLNSNEWFNEEIAALTDVTTANLNAFYINENHDLAYLDVEAARLEKLRLEALEVALIETEVHYPRSAIYCSFSFDESSFNADSNGVLAYLELFKT